MGLFDSLAKQALGSVMGGSNGGIDPGAVMKLLANQSQATEAVTSMLGQVGGVSGLLGKFKDAGLGDAVASWVGGGDNQEVAPEQVESALGPDLVQGFASNIGLNAGQLLPLLSKFLPSIIDKLTPGGKVDAGAPSGDMMQSVIASVIKSSLGGFGGKS
jgi:uncharacterized protein YidB (DUF937 family)